MTRINPLSIDAASDEVKAVFVEIEKAFGRVPNLFTTLAHFPPLLKANWEKYKAVMLKGSLSRQGKETIALLVSQDNNCCYCVAAHSQALKALGLSESQLETIRTGNLEVTGLNLKEIELVNFARIVNNHPHNIPDSIFENMKKLGITDAEIVESLGVLELFIGFNKFIDCLQVEQDF